MKRALVHSETDIAHELGYVGEWLDTNEYSVERMYRDNTDSPISFPPADLLINLGSLNSAADGYTQAPALAEIDAIEEWINTGNPYIGICYGAHLLANAMGGRVERQPSTLRTVESVNTPEVLGPWVRWHEDFIIDVGPARVHSRSNGVVLLFQSGSAWGVQPHLELTPETLTRMATSAGTPPEHYLPLVESLSNNQAEARDSAFALFDRMVGHS